MKIGAGSAWDSRTKFALELADLRCEKVFWSSATSRTVNNALGLLGILGAQEDLRRRGPPT
eukprot:6519351-Alexandrium_andersonii.AAC.1